MDSLEVTRKLDSTGRLMIPKPLREKYGFKEGEAYEFFIHEFKGRDYLCIPCPISRTSEINQALAILQKAGYHLSK